MITVWHFDHKKADHETSWKVFSGQMKPKFDEGNYKKVAVVDTDHLDVAYEKTNHIDQAWWENREILSFEPKSRSTSVGDVLIDVDQCRLFYVASVGFDEFI